MSAPARNRSYETTKVANDHHGAAVRMARFDRQPAEVRRILAGANTNVRVPGRPLTTAEAKKLAGRRA